MRVIEKTNTHLGEIGPRERYTPVTSLKIDLKFPCSHLKCRVAPDF